ncbi:MAG: hypothetical protein Unbinned5350contig1004_17 [Prokaryotic dsDNA virus sp.]|nr:MAG: hypothetical protein Unbinned5350contig1004_17 [Prokaryotic dsDNA virus sp.]|tara:strand:+ start:7048 stop:7266 length:219 start_codon:yes stop_codon:yes gene_type:complete
MDIAKITFQFKEVKTHTLTISAENGWDMPKDPNRLVELVNEIKNQPHKFIADCETDIEYEIEVINSNIIEEL